MAEKLLINQISVGLSVMTASEKRVARIVLSDYPSAGLLPITKLAELSHVSGTTVLRFVKRLGFEGYLEFQSRLIGELSERKLSFLDLYEERITGLKDHKLIQRFVQLHRDKLVTSLTNLPVAEFDQTIKILSNPKLRVMCIGGRFTDYHAKYLASHLHELRPSIRFTEDSHIWRNEQLLDFSKKDVVVIFDVRRYQKDTVEFARKAHKKGAKIILVTDPYLSPVASIAACVLPVEVEGPSAFDSTLNIMALVELLITGVVENLGEKARARIKNLEEIRIPFEYTESNR